MLVSLGRMKKLFSGSDLFCSLGFNSKNNVPIYIILILKTRTHTGGKEQEEGEELAGLLFINFW